MRESSRGWMSALINCAYLLTKKTGHNILKTFFFLFFQKTKARLDIILQNVSGGLSQQRSLDHLHDYQMQIINLPIRTSCSFESYDLPLSLLVFDLSSSICLCKHQYPVSLLVLVASVGFYLAVTSGKRPDFQMRTDGTTPVYQRFSAPVSI